MFIQEGGRLIIQEQGKVFLQSGSGAVSLLVIIAWLGMFFFIFAKLGRFRMWFKVKNKGDVNGKEKT